MEPLILTGESHKAKNTPPAAGGVLLSVFPKMDRAVGQTVEGLAGGGDQIFQYAGLGEDRGGFEAHREDWCLLL